MEELIKLVGSGGDTLILNVRYYDSNGQPIKQEIDEKLAQELDYLQWKHGIIESVVATDWAFRDVLLFVEPHVAGKLWRFTSTHNCRLYMATTQLASGRSPLDVLRQLGHSPLKMTDHYASLSREQLQKSHEKHSTLRAKSDAKDEAFGSGYWNE